MARRIRNKVNQIKNYYLKLATVADRDVNLIGTNIIPIDLYYGIIDYKSDPVYPSEANIKEFVTNPDVLAIDFVVDAFEKFQKDIDQAVHSGRVARNSFLNKIEPTKGWQSATNMYHEHMSEVYSAFVGEYLRDQRRHALVSSFDDFVSLFNNFLKINIEKYPITLSKYIISSKCSRRISGLIVEVLDKDYNDTQYSQSVLDDPSFELYRNTARKYGFKIDITVPWRLVADIKTSEMRSYMNRSDIPYKSYGVTSTETLFDSYYYKAYKKDALLLKKYLISFYNNFVASLRFSKKVCPGTVKATTEFVVREQVDEYDLDQFYDDASWAILYFKIRLIEEKINITPSQYSKIRKKILFLNQRKNFEYITVFIKKKILKLARDQVA